METTALRVMSLKNSCEWFEFYLVKETFDFKVFLRFQNIRNKILSVFYLILCTSGYFFKVC